MSLADRQAVAPETAVPPSAGWRKWRRRKQAESSAAPSEKGLERQRAVTAMTVVVLALIVIMQVGSLFAPDYILPSPLIVLEAIYQILTTELSHLGITLLRLAAGVAFALVVGVLVGLVMGIFPRVRHYLHSIILIDTGIPALSWMLLAVFWFKEPEARIFFVLTAILLPFYALNVYDGIRALPKELVDMAESFRPSRWQMVRYLILPHVVPYIFITTRSLVGYAVRMAIFTELVVSAVGIGARMSVSQASFRIDHVLAWTVLLIVLNLLLQAGVTRLEKTALRWRPEAAMR